MKRWAPSKRDRALIVARGVLAGGTVVTRARGRQRFQTGDLGDDTVGFAAVVNGISRVHQQFLNAGGLGILVGGGQLPRPGPEYIAEAYCDVALAKPVHLSLDAQFVAHPGYNRDRGPVPVGGLRLHAQF